MVSNPDDLRILEKQVAEPGDDPLLAGGSCINTFMSGGAAKRLMTVTALGEKSSQRREGERADFNLFFLSPNAYTKAVLASVWDYLAGLVMAVAGPLRQVPAQAEIFSIKRLAQRTLANAFLRDLSFYWMKHGHGARCAGDLFQFRGLRRRRPLHGSRFAGRPAFPGCL